MKKNIEYTFTPDDLVDYVKSFTSEHMTEFDSYLALSDAKDDLRSLNRGIVGFCKRRDGEPTQDCDKPVHPETMRVIDENERLRVQIEEAQRQFDHTFDASFAKLRFDGEAKIQEINVNGPQVVRTYIYPAGTTESRVEPPEPNRILPVVPHGVDCEGLLFVGLGDEKWNLDEKLDCLKSVYKDLRPSLGGKTGCSSSRMYAIDLTYPLEQVNEALARFGLDRLDRLYYDKESFPDDGYVEVLFKDGTTVTDYCLYTNSDDHGPKIGWKPREGIKGAQ